MTFARVGEGEKTCPKTTKTGSAGGSEVPAGEIKKRVRGFVKLLASITKYAGKRKTFSRGNTVRHQAIVVSQLYMLT